jgi:hypothetical protein
MEYTSLNKACPKDPFPLPCIDQVVNSTSGCKTLYFLNSYFGYHQIAMKESDQLMTSFITPFRSYCYISMSFGLKNASNILAMHAQMFRWSHQRDYQGIHGQHHSQVQKGWPTHGWPQKNLQETLRNGIKLNPKKCVFEVPRGMLLGFIVSECGIKANPEKITTSLGWAPFKM